MSESQLNVITCSFPTPDHPYYHVVLRAVEFPEKSFEVERVEANNRWIRDFWVYNDGVWNNQHIFVAGSNSTIVIRHDWQNGSTNRVSLKAKADDGTVLNLSVDFTAPAWGGYGNPAWKYYASLVLTESRGLAQMAEPVHTTLGIYADRLTSAEREVRVVSVDPESGVQTEVPCQVDEVSTWSALRDERCQPIQIGSW
jgi:hypothetical protein